MPGIPFPKPISVAPFAPPANEPTYSQIFDQVMGNAATPTDGMDAALTEIAMLTDGAFLDEADFANDLLNLSDLAAGFGDAAEGALATALQPASDATDAALSDYGVLVPPPAPTPQPVNPPSGSPPSPAPTQPPPPGKVPQVILPAMRVGNAEVSIEVGGASWTSLEIEPQVFDLTAGDPLIFHWRRAHTEQPTGHGDKILTDTWYLLVNPTKAGTFTATVEETDQTSDPQVVTDKDYTVTITA